MLNIESLRCSSRRGLLIFVLLELTGCGGSEAQLCKDGAAVLCSKLFECFTTDTERAALGVGATALECTTRAQKACEARPQSDGGTSDSPCDPPLRYDASAAAQCTSELKALKCSLVRTGSTPVSCDRTCR